MTKVTQSNWKYNYLPALLALCVGAACFLAFPQSMTYRVDVYFDTNTGDLKTVTRRSDKPPSVIVNESMVSHVLRQGKASNGATAQIRDWRLAYRKGPKTTENTRIGQTLTKMYQLEAEWDLAGTTVDRRVEDARMFLRLIKEDRDFDVIPGATGPRLCIMETPP